MQQRGISYSLNFIFGWETEKEDVFQSTLDFLRENRVPVAYFNILTPHRGTPLFDRMEAENRIINVHQIGRWPGIACHIKPPGCSACELERRVRKMYLDFYSYPSMLARLSFPSTRSRIASWILNMSERRICGANSHMEDFDQI